MVVLSPTRYNTSEPEFCIPDLRLSSTAHTSFENFETLVCPPADKDTDGNVGFALAIPKRGDRAQLGRLSLERMAIFTKGVP